MPHVMQAGGNFMSQFSGGGVKAVRNSGIIEFYAQILGANVLFGPKEKAGTLCHFDSNGKLAGGATKDKNGGYRIDLQGMTSTVPVRANLQIQANIKANPSTVSCVLVPVGTTFTTADLVAAFYASMTAVKEGSTTCVALMT